MAFVVKKCGYAVRERSTDGGSYAGLTIAKAEKIEPSLRGSTNARLVSMSGHPSSFRLTAQSRLTGQTFSISMGPSGQVKRRCSLGLACATGVW